MRKKTRKHDCSIHSNKPNSRKGDSIGSRNQIIKGFDFKINIGNSFLRLNNEN